MNNLLGDIRKIINDAWEFFAPPLIRLAIMAAFFWYVCGAEPLSRLWGYLGAHAPVLAGDNVQAFLTRFNLTALAPVIGLFLISLLAYSVNRIIFGVASLIPVQLFTYSTLIEKLVGGDPGWRKHLEQPSGTGASQVIDYALARARLEKKEYLLSGIDYWSKKAGSYSLLFSFATFLLTWSVACAVLSVKLRDEGSAHFTYGRMTLLVGGVITFGFYCACKYAEARKQEGYAKVSAARAILDAEGNKRKGERHDGQTGTRDASQEVEEVRRLYKQGPWWGIRLGLMDWRGVIGEIGSPDNYQAPRGWRVWLKALASNAANILWFTLAAFGISVVGGISWWVGCVLFVGYVSVTIVGSLICAAAAAATLWPVALSRLRKYVPADAPRADARGEADGTLRPSDEIFRAAVAGVRVAEALTSDFMKPDEAFGLTAPRPLIGPPTKHHEPA